jgi:hypothetical protein
MNQSHLSQQADKNPLVCGADFKLRSVSITVQGYETVARAAEPRSPPDGCLFVELKGSARDILPHHRLPFPTACACGAIIIPPIGIVKSSHRISHQVVSIRIS